MLLLDRLRREPVTIATRSSPFNYTEFWLFHDFCLLFELAYSILLVIDRLFSPNIYSETQQSHLLFQSMCLMKAKRHDPNRSRLTASLFSP